jgi:DNA-binding MarR family transcriptional regulator
MPGADPRVEAVRAVVRVCRFLERSSKELSLAHYRVLVAVASGERRASRVAQLLSVGKPAVSAAVDALLERGLLAADAVVGDQRGTSLRLTAAGDAVLRRVEQGMAARLDQLVEGCEHATPLAAMVDLGAALEGLSQRPPVVRAGHPT